MRRLQILVSLLSWGALSAPAQTQVNLKTQSKDIDFSGSSSTKTVQAGSSLPSTCAQSQLFLLLSASPGQNLYICTAANTWTLESGGSGGGGGSLSGLTTNALVTANGSTSVQTPDGSATMDSSGNIRTPGTISAGVGSGPGFLALPQGTTPLQSAFPANSFSLVANPSIPAPYQWVAPPADSAGAIVSNGNATPGTLSIQPIQGTDGSLLSAGSISGAGAALCTDANGGATTSGCASPAGAYYAELGPLVGVDYNSNNAALTRGWQTISAGQTIVGGGTSYAPYDALIFTENATTAETLVGSTWLPPSIPASVTVELLAYTGSESSAFNVGFDLATACAAFGGSNWKAPSFPAAATATTAGATSQPNYGYLLSWTVSLSSCSPGNTLWLKFDRNNSITGNLTDWVFAYDIRIHQ